MTKSCNKISSSSRVDCSALSRLSSSSESSGSLEYSFSFPNYLTYEEARASILILLNKFLSSSLSSSAIAATSTQLYDVFCNLNGPASSPLLNSLNFQVGGFCQNNGVGDYSLAALVGISALLDHRFSALAPVAEAVAALSCEALRADISAFYLVDSADGFPDKNEVAVASDVKVFFNDSKLVVKDNNEPGFDAAAALAISMIPAVYGNFREACQLLHSKTRVQLSCTAFRDGSAQVMSTTLSFLAQALCNLADTSSSRTKLLIDSLPSDELRSILGALGSGINSISQLYSSSQAALKDKDYIRFSHQIYSLLDAVRKNICWEATAAFVPRISISATTIR